jgi:hypothetical protein
VLATALGSKALDPVRADTVPVASVAGTDWTTHIGPPSGLVGILESQTARLGVHCVLRAVRDARRWFSVKRLSNTALTSKELGRLDIQHLPTSASRSA